MRRRMSTLEVYLRTGRRVADEAELVQTKFNPWHDSENGRFTFAGRGRHFGGGHAGSSDVSAGRRRVSTNPRARVATAPAPARSTPNPARPGPNQDSAVFLRNPKEALERIRMEMSATRNVPASSVLVQRFKTHMIPKEADRSVVYPDSKGIPTVGIGHKVVPGDNLKLGDRISDSRKDAFWREDSAKALTAAQRQAKEAGIADSDFIIALADVNFQLGSGWKQDHKQTWAFIMKGDYRSAAREAQNSKWYRETPTRVTAFQRALLALSSKTARKPTE